MPAPKVDAAGTVWIDDALTFHRAENHILAIAVWISGPEGLMIETHPELSFEDKSRIYALIGVAMFGEQGEA